MTTFVRSAGGRSLGNMNGKGDVLCLLSVDAEEGQKQDYN